MISKYDWQEDNVQEFWNETAPGHHLLQIYENETVFLNSLEGFAGSGLLAGESVIIIATTQHLFQLEYRLLVQGFEIEVLKKSRQYIPIDAAWMLSTFMKEGQPDEKLFLQQVSKVYLQAASASGTIRGFGEMVALLVEAGKSEAALKLEGFWNNFSASRQLTLLCAYPRQVVLKAPDGFIEKVCSCHSKLISGSPQPSTQVLYKRTS